MNIFDKFLTDCVNDSINGYGRKLCMNCGEAKRDVVDGWCGTCEREPADTEFKFKARASTPEEMEEFCRDMREWDE